jgi:hypothetical protein
MSHVNRDSRSAHHGRRDCSRCKETSVPVSLPFVESLMQRTSNTCIRFCSIFLGGGCTRYDKTLPDTELGVPVDLSSASCGNVVLNTGNANLHPHQFASPPTIRRTNVPAPLGVNKNCANAVWLRSNFLIQKQNSVVIFLSAARFRWMVSTFVHESRG